MGVSKCGDAGNARRPRRAVAHSVDQLEERRLLAAVAAAPDQVIFQDSVSAPLAANPGHSFYVSGQKSNGSTPTQYSDASAITPFTTNDLVMNVSPFSTNYSACS